ncbi:receptor expression-enhancing protein 2-like isoform X1 [Teleopsis dalmanni]|uniref:receptor expression-enhancing protein 2-like isoform X1 n=1 Tax=Teleopsis dalmanni TaxID=139649 RepID=UPI0018CF359A|nr:receptor expression-enhancing protein 2-like isoform X1 [Teleopsis dalmanni]
MISALVSRLIVLTFGTLYPAYASYKAVRTKNVKEYVKWMMYWIVYAFFTCIETVTDIFLSWFPFYYEIKIVIVLWLLSPATKGSSTLYRKFVHPMLTRREQEIDEYLNQAKERGYSAVLQLGYTGVTYAKNVIMQSALKGGGNLVQTIRRSYSLSDLSEPDLQRTQDEVDEISSMRPQHRVLRNRMQASLSRSASGSRHSTGMYFTEVDVTKTNENFNYNIRSSEDISSGYSSAEPISSGLSRASSMTNASKTRLRTKRPEIQNLDSHEELFYNLPLPYDTGLNYFQNTNIIPSEAFGNEKNKNYASENLNRQFIYNHTTEYGDPDDLFLDSLSDDVNDNINLIDFNKDNDSDRESDNQNKREIKNRPRPHLYNKAKAPRPPNERKYNSDSDSVSSQSVFSTGSGRNKGYETEI